MTAAVRTSGFGRLLVVIALALGLAASPLTASTARASVSNVGDGDCFKSFNRADDRGFLYAVTSVKSGTSCQHVRVAVFNDGLLSGPGGGTGWTEGSSCSGFEPLGSATGNNGHVALMVMIDSADWFYPCSDHRAGASPGQYTSHGGLWFTCPGSCAL